MTALRESVCVPFAKNKGELDDKSTLRLILLYTRKANSFSSETIIATSFTFPFLEPGCKLSLQIIRNIFDKKLRINPTANHRIDVKDIVHIPIFHSSRNENAFIKVFFSLDDF